MKKTAKYIIEKSLDIASISNSDSLSYTDRVQLLNDIFTQLYQWSINAGEKNWIKEVQIVGNGGKYKLPYDFWQLESIFMGNAKYYGDYEIINGYIHIKHLTGSCKLRYYTKPTYLSFPNKTLDVELNYEGTMRHANGKYAVTYEITDNGDDTHNTVVRVYDIEKNEKVCEKTFELEEIEDVFIYRNIFWIPYDDDVYFYDFSGNETSHYEITMDVTDLPVADYIYLDEDNLELKNVYGQTIYTFEEGTTFSYPKVLYRENIGTVLFSNDSKVYVIDVDQNTMEELEEWNSELIPYDLGYFNEKLCIYCGISNSITDRAVVVGNNIYYDKIDTDKMIYKIYGLKVNEESGYGFLILHHDKTVKIQSFVPDIEFNAPNNMFYSLLIYKLAQAYCSKLNVENNRLDATVSDMEHTYFDTLKTNISKNYTLKDVYDNRRNFYEFD